MSTMARRMSVLAAITALMAVGCGDDDGDDGTPVDMMVTEDMGECVPTTCAAESADCGMIADGCGAMIDCGGCTDPETCGGGGTPNVCGEGECTPTTTCEDEGAECGMIDNGCSVVSCTDTCDADTEMCSDENLCVDAACTPTLDEEVSWEACTDGEDNDCNELTDRAEESGCAVCPPPGDAASAATEGTDALCGDGIDNDCDGFVDCADFDCAGSTACPDEDTDALCSDGIDNDGDGRIDCLGRSCTEAAAVTVCDAASSTTEDDTTFCSDLLDNDGDDRVDCDDDDCEGIGYCAGDGEDEADVTDGCIDELDNDGDGLIDCADRDCEEAAACLGENDAATCTDGLDNDGDGRIDCADSDCYTDPAFTVCLDTQEDCTTAGDEDFDGLDTCFDPECLSVCEAEACAADNPVGTCTEATQVCTLTGSCATPLSEFDLSSEQVLVISEFMANPAIGSDGDREYIELTNVSGEDITLDGLEIADAGSSFDAPTGYFLAAGATATFVGDTDTTNNGGITAAGEQTFGLNNSGGDSVTISFGGTVIHTVAYPGTGNDVSNTGANQVEGQSWQLDKAFIDALVAGTSATARWCLTPNDGTYEYATDGTDTDHGTPDAENIECSVTCGDGTCSVWEDETSCAADCATATPAPSAAGQIVITEVMQNPTAVPDPDGEYFEVYNPSATDSYDLINCTITSNTNGPVTITANLVVGPGEYKVLAYSASPGFTADYVYDSAISLGNSSDDVQLTCGGTLIDIVAWDDGATFPDPSGASMNLSPTALDATSNDTGANWCTSTSDLGNTDLGTPGAANDTCP